MEVTEEQGDGSSGFHWKRPDIYNFTIRKNRCSGLQPSGKIDIINQAWAPGHNT